MRGNLGGMLGIGCTGYEPALITALKMRNSGAGSARKANENLDAGRLGEVCRDGVTAMELGDQADKVEPKAEVGLVLPALAAGDH